VVDRADSAFYSEVVRRERFDVDAQQVRRHFEFAKVRQELLDVTGRLFGLSYARVQDAEPWHEDVAVCDVQFEGTPLGRMYLNLHPERASTSMRRSSTSSRASAIESCPRASWCATSDAG
jgi:thimet oligopeptidase